MEEIKLKKSIIPREYQNSIFENSKYKNSFVVLPTGLGKTLISIMMTIFYYNKFNKKVLFLAPTKPLVVQQKKAFENSIENISVFKVCELLGTIAPKKRETLYLENDFFFSTPQLIENDIINKRINLEDFSFVVFDEAHRASGNYAYCFVAKECLNFDVKTLSLSASPADNYLTIKEIFDNLFIEHIEVRKLTDIDVLEYSNKTNIERVELDLTSDFLDVKKLLDEVYSKILEKLKTKGYNILGYSKTNSVSKTTILEFQSRLRVKIAQNEMSQNDWDAIALSSALMKLEYGIELTLCQDLTAAYNYFLNIINTDKSKAATFLNLIVEFREVVYRLKNLTSKNILHPKLIYLKENLDEKFSENKDLKIIIFSSYRESAKKIEKVINENKKIKASIFLGQAKKGDISFSQKKQKEVIEKFREGEFNVLISTSVGEEGLDIPKVDLVIFYEPVPSAIRTIQRVGRTGRFNEGNAIFLITKETKEVITKFVSDAKQKRMYLALDKIKDNLREEQRYIKKEEVVLDNDNFEKLKKSFKIEIKEL